MKRLLAKVLAKFSKIVTAEFRKRKKGGYLTVLIYLTESN